MQYRPVFAREHHEAVVYCPLGAQACGTRCMDKFIALVFLYVTKQIYCFIA